MICCIVGLRKNPANCSHSSLYLSIFWGEGGVGAGRGGVTHEMCKLESSNMEYIYVEYEIIS